MEKINKNVLAKHYHSLGLNVTCIKNEINEFNILESNLLKSPCHDWLKFQEKKQSEEDLQSIDWTDATGVGVVLGYDGIMAIDIDNCIEIDLVKIICSILDIDENYSWIIRSGSECGFHILLKCQNRNVDVKPFTNYELKFGLIYRKLNEKIENEDDINAYYSKNEFLEDHLSLKYFKKNILLSKLFEKIEFRWSNHLVLPNSLHQSGNSYAFLNGLPISEPSEITIEKLENLKDLLCTFDADWSGWHGEKRVSQIACGDGTKKILGKNTNNFRVPRKIYIHIERNSSSNNKQPSSEIVQICWLLTDGSPHIDQSKIIRSKIFVTDSYNINNECRKEHPVIKDAIRKKIGKNLKNILEELMQDIRSIKLYSDKSYQERYNTIITFNHEIVLNLLIENFQHFGLNYDSFLSMSKIGIKEVFIGTKSYKGKSYNEKYACSARISDGEKLKNPQLKDPSLVDLYNYIFETNHTLSKNAMKNAIMMKLCYESDCSILNLTDV